MHFKDTQKNNGDDGYGHHDFKQGKTGFMKMKSVSQYSNSE
jgi:hypothetical protein